MSEFVLALDQGTTSSRAILFDGDGGIRSTAQREFRQIYPQPGWVEHDPSDIWASQLGVAAEALEAAGVTAGDLAAVGISNQRETAIVWDRHTLEPIYNAIVWQDRRTAGFIDQLKSEGLADYFQATTGLVLDAYFFGQQGSLAARSRRRGEGARRVRRARFRHRRQLAVGAADRR